VCWQDNAKAVYAALQEAVIKLETVAAEEGVLAEMADGPAKQEAVKAAASKATKDIMANVSVVESSAESRIEWAPDYVKSQALKDLWDTL
jgi:hypothetical protein